jgi:hypothetical protein
LMCLILLDCDGFIAQQTGNNRKISNQDPPKHDKQP